MIDRKFAFVDRRISEFDRTDTIDDQAEALLYRITGYSKLFDHALTAKDTGRIAFATDKRWFAGGIETVDFQANGFAVATAVCEQVDGIDTGFEFQPIAVIGITTGFGVHAEGVFLRIGTEFDRARFVACRMPVRFGIVYSHIRTRQQILGGTESYDCQHRQQQSGNLFHNKLLFL